MDLRSRGEYTGDLFVAGSSDLASKLMATLDEVNAEWGGGLYDGLGCRKRRSGG